MEDFGYKKIDDKTELPGAAKRVLLGFATLFSIAVFIYITISAYYFVYQDKNSDIETIHSPEGPIKVTEAEEDTGIKVDHDIYEDIFGSKKGSLANRNVKVRDRVEPALPKKEVVKKEENKKEVIAKEAEKIVVYSAEKKEPPKQILNKDEREIEKRDNTAPAQKKRSTEKRIIRVQIAAMSSREAALDQWGKLNSNYSSIFSDLKPYVEKVDLGKRGVFHRLQIGNFPDQISAEKFCSRYVAQTRKSSADCIIVE
jgi:hypothetical protein